MIIDILYILLLVLALVKGWRNGFVIAIFSVLGLIVGLVAAMKLSAVTAAYLKDATNISVRWLPFVSFIIVFIAVAFLIRLGAKLISKAMEMVALGWANKLAGVLLYAAVYTIVLSVVIFYCQKITVFSESTIAESRCYSFIQPWGPIAVDGIGKIIPWFKDMFGELEHFFDNIATKASK